MRNRPILVSACLLGLKTRYDGRDAFSAAVAQALDGRLAIPVCPEQLGGLSTPRPRAEITEGDGYDVIKGHSCVITEGGADVTESFVKGAREVLKIALLTEAQTAFLKEKSPSCGVETICRGTECVKGMGVTAALLRNEGFEVKGF